MLWEKEIIESYIKNPQEAHLYYEGYRLGFSSEYFLIEQEANEHYTLEQARQITAEDYYEYGLMQYNSKNYKIAKRYFKKSYDMFKEEIKYKEALELVNTQIQTVNIEIIHKNSIKSYNNGDYETAKIEIERLLKTSPNNQNFVALSEKINKQQVEIMKCTKQAILTLDGFNEEKANNFIKLRAEGVKWYDLDSFVEQFELMPIEKKQIQGRVIFPLRQGAKLGRRIDF